MEIKKSFETFETFTDYCLRKFKMKLNRLAIQIKVSENELYAISNESSFLCKEYPKDVTSTRACTS